MNAPGWTIQVWNPRTRSLVATLVGHQDLVRGLAFSRDAKTLYSAADDGTVRIWDLVTQHQVASMPGHTRWITSLSLMPDESLLASSSADGTIRIWDLKLQREKLRLTTHAPMVWDVKFSPNGRLMATCGVDQRIRLWDTAVWKEIQVLQGHLSEVWRVAFSPDGMTLASGGKDETVKLWSAEPKVAPPSERVFTLETDRTGGTLSCDGRWFWFAAAGRLTIGDTRSLRDLRDFVPNSQRATNATVVLLDSSGSRLYLGYADGWVGSLDLNTGREVKSPVGHGSTVTVLALSADGKRLVSASQRGSVCVQDADNFQSLITLTNAGTALNCLCFSRDGILLAGASQLDDIFLWDLRTGTQRSRMTGHKGRILSLNFSPDGRRFGQCQLGRNGRPLGRHHRQAAGHPPRAPARGQHRRLQSGRPASRRGHEGRLDQTLECGRRPGGADAHGSSGRLSGGVSSRRRDAGFRDSQCHSTLARPDAEENHRNRTSRAAGTINFGRSWIKHEGSIPFTRSPCPWRGDPG
jgi:WD40 repeat protein